jgi:uncharacterized protein (TIGR03067 family)
MRSLLIALAALFATSLFAADDKGGKPKSDHELIQGTWKVVSAQEAGRKRKVPDDFRFVITADVLSMKSGKDDPISVKYKLDPSKRPKAMDTSHEIDPGKPIVQLAIYALDGDELKLCLEAAGKPRPTRLESKAGSTSVLFVLKRVKKGEK